MSFACLEIVLCRVSLVFCFLLCVFACSIDWTESETGTGRKGFWMCSGPTAGQWHPELGPGLCPGGFWGCPGWIHPPKTSPGGCQGSSPSQGAAPGALGEPPGCQVVLTASAAGTGHLWSALAQFLPHLQIPVHIDTPWTCSSQAEPAQVSQPSPTRDTCQSLNYLNGPLLDSLHCVSASHVLGILISIAKYSYFNFDFFRVHWAF